MLRRVLKWVGIVLGGLVALVAIAVAVLYFSDVLRLDMTYSVQPEAIPVPADAQSVARGKHLVESVGECISCHGSDLAGTVAIDAPGIATISGANLTRGQGGLGNSLSDADFVRAIRHGVRADGKAMLVMPVQDYYYLSDQDLADIIAYLKSVPPVDKPTPYPQIGLLGRILLQLGALPGPGAETINHTAPRPVAPPPGPNAAYGEYLVRVASCRGCHADNLAGGPLPGQPDAPHSANLTPAGGLAGWSTQDFIKTLRSGVNPSGHHLLDLMPWQDYGRMTDEELTAVSAYLKTLPPTQPKN